MNEPEFDDEDFHREHYRNAVEKAKAGDVESAWYLISTYVDWVDGSLDPSPVAAFFGEFFGTLLEIRSNSRPSPPTRDQLATALQALGIVSKRGRPSSKGTDANARRLAAEELLRRPQDEGGHGMGADEAREKLERAGLGALRQRDVRSEDSPTAMAIALLSTTELAHLANDGEEMDDVYRHASAQPGPDCGERARLTYARRAAAAISVKDPDGSTTAGDAYVDDLIQRGYRKPVQRGGNTWLANALGEAFRLPAKGLARYARLASADVERGAPPKGYSGRSRK